MASKRLIRVGVDTGGTFTDFVFEQDGRLNLFKLPSTPSDPSLAIQEGRASALKPVRESIKSKSSTARLLELTRCSNDVVHALH